MTNEIVGAAIGGFLAWTLAHFAALFLRRQRLKSYLEICLWNHFESSRDNQKWLKRVERDTVRPGQAVSGAPLFTRDEIEDITSVLEQSLELLRRSELARLTRCYRLLWEIEALFEGFCSGLREYQDSGRPLTESDVQQLLKRARRINALVDQLPTRPTSIQELPECYPGCIGAETLVPDPPAVNSATPAAPTDPCGRQPASTKG